MLRMYRVQSLVPASFRLMKSLPQMSISRIASWMMVVMHWIRMLSDSDTHLRSGRIVTL